MLVKAEESKATATAMLAITITARMSFGTMEDDFLDFGRYLYCVLGLDFGFV